MNSKRVKELIFSFIFLFIIQLPLIHRFILFDIAFGFFYVGFILLLPVKMNRSYQMLIGFVLGLIIDIFTNTPGMHASSCVLIMFVKNLWLRTVYDDWQNIALPNLTKLGSLGFVNFYFPLIILHHTVLFTLENNGFYMPFLLIKRIVLSSIFSFLVIFIFSHGLKSSKDD